MGGADDGEEQRQTLWYQFKQRRLKAWQPILTPAFTIPGYLICGVLFSVVGALLLFSSWRVEEIMHDYTDEQPNGSGIGSFELNIQADMEPPIWVYYQLEGFYQNHRRYVKSYDPSQLQQADAPKTSMNVARSKCTPENFDAAGRVLYPCGLVARSVFNDTFVLVQRQEGGDWERVYVDSEASTIAWPADINGKFRNADPEGIDPASGQQYQAALNMWILGWFPPVDCQQWNFSNGKEYVPVSLATRMDRNLQVVDCAGYMSGNPQCRFVRNGQPFVCEGDYRLVKRMSWGIESGHLIVWMRIAGLPTFRKLWGKVTTPLKAGTTLKVYYSDNFPVKPFYGRKALVLSTGSILGGRNDILGYGYIAVGCCCLVFGMWKLIHCLYCPRPLGDISFLAQPH